jgi:multiple sugar transport system permease protein
MKFKLKRKTVIKSILFLIAFAVVLIWIFPLLWAISSSFKTPNELIMNEFRLIPKKFTFDNYLAIFNSRHDPILRWFLNSIVVALSNVVLYLLIASLAAYSFARLKFKGRQTIFWICLSSMMIPGIVNFVPNFVIVDKLGWLNTLYPMIFPGLSGVFGVFLLRQFMLSIPKDLDEAAYMDGASRFYVYYKVIVPLCKPAMATLAIFSFQGSWNDFMWPLIVTDLTEWRTLTAGLSIFLGNHNTDYGVLMAGAIISAIPVLIVFILLQKYFVEGITLTGMKG